MAPELVGMILQNILWSTHYKGKRGTPPAASVGREHGHLLLLDGADLIAEKYFIKYFMKVFNLAVNYFNL